MHLRVPAWNQNVVAFVWAVSLAAFVFIGMLGLSISMGTSIVTSIVCAGIIFWAVAKFGVNAPRRRSRPAGRRPTA
jgi:hypothetical protein